MSFLLLLCRYTVWHLIRSAFSCRDFNYKNCLAINLFCEKTRLIIRTDKVVNMRQPKSSTEHTLRRLQIYTFRHFPANFPPSFFAVKQNWSATKETLAEKDTIFAFNNNVTLLTCSTFNLPKEAKYFWALFEITNTVIRQP